MRLATSIGLEIHVQLKTATKLFCGCEARWNAAPNSLICPVCTGQPGALPRLNRRALHLAVKAGRALGAKIATRTGFDRKNYFYPDLPKGYQITQYFSPVAREGALEIQGPDRAAPRSIRIPRIHLEEDAGKVLNLPDAQGSYLDLNRAGMPLLEIVTAPEIRSPEEAVAFLKSLRTLLRWIDVSGCEMEKGSLRCDVNLSLAPAGDSKLGTRVEIKNLNSFRHVKKALEFETARQGVLLSSGSRVAPETRGWHEEKKETLLLRTKEQVQDYRYFPEPDLPQFPLDPSWLLEALPELPGDRQRRFVKEHGISWRDAEMLTAEMDRADYYEACLAACGAPRQAAGWILSVLLKGIKDRGKDLTRQEATPARLGRLIRLVEEGALTRPAARQVLSRILDRGGEPEEVLREEGFDHQFQERELRDLVQNTLPQAPDSVRDFLEGKTAALNDLIGRAMRACGGRADPVKIRRFLLEAMDRPEEENRS